MACTTSTTSCGELLMRDSLDHCVKCTICETFCPVSNVTPLFPGPEVRRPAGRALPRRRTSRRPTPRSTTARAAASARRSARRACTSPRSTRRRGAKLQGATGVQAARPAARAPDLRRPRSARPSRRSPTGRCATGRCALLGEKTVGLHRDAPMPQLRRAARSRRWARKHTVARRPRGASPTSTAAARTTTSRDLGEMTVALLEHNGSRSTSRSRTAAGCRCSPTACSTTRAPYVHAARRASSRRTRATGVDIVGTSTSCTLMLKREAREILGHGRRRRSCAWSPSACSTSASTCSRCTSAASCETDFAPLPSRRSPTTRRASSRATASASRRST